jgi:hypothetical protein
LIGKGEHDGENGEDKRKDKEKGRGRDGSVMTVGGTFRAMRVPLSVMVSMGTGYPYLHGCRLTL